MKESLEDSKEPTTLEQLALKELKRDIEKQLAATELRLQKLREILGELEAQETKLQKQPGEAKKTIQPANLEF